MKVFGNPATKAKIRRYIVWGIEDGIVCAHTHPGVRKKWLCLAVLCAA